MWTFIIGSGCQTKAIALVGCQHQLICQLPVPTSILQYCRYREFLAFFSGEENIDEAKNMDIPPAVYLNSTALRAQCIICIHTAKNEYTQWPLQAWPLCR
jgi:hypothetical protein